MQVQKETPVVDQREDPPKHDLQTYAKSRLLSNLGREKNTGTFQHATS